MDRASDAVKNLDSKKLLDQAQQWYGSAKPYITDAAKKSSTLTKKYPLQAIIGAVCLGFLCSLFFRRKVI